MTDKYILLIDDAAVCKTPAGGGDAGSRAEIEDLKEQMEAQFPDTIYRMYQLVELKS